MDKKDPSRDVFISIQNGNCKLRIFLDKSNQNGKVFSSNSLSPVQVKQSGIHGVIVMYCLYFSINLCCWFA